MWADGHGAGRSSPARAAVTQPAPDGGGNRPLAATPCRRTCVPVTNDVCRSLPRWTSRAGPPWCRRPQKPDRRSPWRGHAQRGVHAKWSPGPPAARQDSSDAPWPAGGYTPSRGPCSPRSWGRWRPSHRWPRRRQGRGRVTTDRFLQQPEERQRGTWRRSPAPGPRSPAVRVRNGHQRGARSR